MPWWYSSSIDDLRRRCTSGSSEPLTSCSKVDCAHLELNLLAEEAEIVGRCHLGVRSQYDLEPALAERPFELVS